MPRTPAMICALLLAAMTSAAVVSTTAAQPARISLDPNTTHQTITAWAATAWAGQAEVESFDLYKDEVYDRVVDELGINRLRLEVRAGVESDRPYWAEYQAGSLEYADWRAFRYATVDDNGDPNTIDWDGFHFEELDNTVEQVVLPIKQRLEASGERLLINVNYVAFTGQITQVGEYHHDRPEEYAEFVLATYLHLRDKYGVVPDTWEVILEPDNVRQWDGELIGQAIVASARRLEANGFSARFIGPSNTNMSRAITYFDDMAAVTDALSSLEEFSYHRYGGVSHDNLRLIAIRAQRHGVNTSMLEHIGSGYEDLHQDLKVGLNSSWQQYTLGGPGTSDQGGHYYMVDDSDRQNPVVRPARRTPYLRQYFRFVRPGAQRIGANSVEPTFDPLAFINVDGRYVVVVKADAGGEFEVLGLPGGTYAVSHTTEQGTVVEGERAIESGEALIAAIPAQGVVTVSDASSPRPTVSPTPHTVTPTAPTATSTSDTPTPGPTPEGIKLYLPRCTADGR